MPYAKDSAIIILKATEDGYVASYYVWGVSPPPIGMDLALALDNTEEPTTTRQDRISDDKTALKTELGQLIDSYFDI